MTSKISSSDSTIPVKYEYSPRFPEILEHCRVSLLISTYQAGKLMVLGSQSGKLEISFRSLELAMGIAAAEQGIAVGSKRNVWFLSSHPELARSIRPAGAYDACFLTRHAQFTGNIQVHELAWGSEGLWVVNTLFSTLCTLHDDFNFVPRWQPKFISSLAAEDRCHLNGIAMEQGAPRFVTAMSQTDTAAGWRPTKAESGVVIDVASQEIVCSGLAMPHSPRVYDQRLWVLDSGRGGVSQVDLHRGTADIVARLPGYTRGLAFNGQFAFVGLSRIREAHIFGGLPVQKEFDQLNCGIGIIDLVSGKNIAAFQFHSGVEEIFDVQLLPGVKNPFLRGPGDEDEQEVWVVPPPTQNLVAASAPNKPIFYRRDLGPNSYHAPANPRQLVEAGLKLQEQGRLAEAAVNYQAAIALDPSYTDPIINLGNVYQELNKSDEAIACYREAIRINPQAVNAYRNLGYLLKEQGLHEEGLEHLRQAQRLEPNPIIEFVLQTNLPPIYSSLEDLQQRRLQLEVNVRKLSDSGFQLDANQSAAPTNFYAAYQGLNDRSLQIQLAGLIRVPQPVLKRRSQKTGSRIRVGFISRHYRNHTIGRLNLGIIRNLPRDLFEVVVISVGSHQDRMAEEFARAADEYVALPTNLSAIRSAVLDLNLDVLYYSDVGMDTLTYTLSLSRLAPVQCTTWGHPETTGSPAIDYFISSQTLETADADQHYSERLERLAVLNVFYYRPVPPEIRDHAYFGLDSEKNNYLCFQNLFKIHPEFDEILRGILCRDPRAAIIMMEPRYPAWGDSLRARWRHSIGSPADRIQFLKTQPHDDFLSLNAIADVSLDPIHFGGGNTSYEAFAVGLPVVTLPSQFLRARISQALYRQMDFVDLIAKSPQQYIDLAVQLGTTPELRKATSKKILEQSGSLFEDHRAIDELVKFFQRVVTARTPNN